MDPKIPVLNISLFLRDIYLLLTMTLADKAINEILEFQSIAGDNYENEVKRLLVFSAVSARQMMELIENDTRKENYREQTCGQFRTRNGLEQTASDKLTFWKACNSIIHAEDIMPYHIAQNTLVTGDTTLPEMYSIYSTTQSTPVEQRCYKGTITVHSEYKGKQEIAEISGQEYAKCCIMLGEGQLKREL